MYLRLELELSFLLHSQGLCILLVQLRSVTDTSYKSHPP